MTAPSHEPLVAAKRNGHIERVHWGSVAVVDASGALLAWAGEPGASVFSRSTLKPFQALPFVRDGGAERFAFSDAQLALCCASHSGERVHVEAITDMLKRIGAQEDDLRCGVHIPACYNADNLPPRGSRFDQRHNNCSGKHTAFLGYCSMHGHPLGAYLERAHPLQRRIRAEVSELAALPAERLWQGTDGCSAPNFGMPMVNLALMWARLASSNHAGGSELDASLERLYQVMSAHPYMVSGAGRFDLAATEASGGDWIVKTGADGILAIGVRSSSIGILIKIADGNTSALYCAALAALEQLELLSPRSDHPLHAWAYPVLRNLRGLEVGLIEPIFTLKKKSRLA